MHKIVKQAQSDNVQFVDLQFTDIMGNTKSVTIPVKLLEEAFERGVWFDGSSIQGFARIHESDMYLLPDPDTYRVLPWTSPERRRARLICDIKRPDGSPFEGDPRYALRRAVERAEEMGYRYNCGPELEFFLFKRNGEDPLTPIPHDVGGYFDFSPKDEAQSIRADIVLALEQMGMNVEASHHEVATGQHEIDFEYADALTAADHAVTFKYTVKAVAASYGVYATFMPKPIFGINGSGMHTHQSLASVEDGSNVFYGPDDEEYHLSELAYQFIAGQLTHARALAAVVAPTVNSYKRLTPGYEAPVYVCWAQINRSALLRIPRYAPGREASTRVELRCPDPSCNPYLAFAAMLNAGLDGIENGLEAPEAVNEDVYLFSPEDLDARGIATLPGTLGEALDELEGDDLLLDALGPHIANVYLQARRVEWEEYRIQVSQWELDRYLDTL